MNPVTNPAMSFMPQNIFHGVLFHADHNSSAEVVLTSADVTALQVTAVVLIALVIGLVIYTRKA